MKILIIGEFSGFSKNLCRGFKKIGHEACAFNWGDYFKKISSEEGSISINIDNYKLLGYEVKYSHLIRRFFSYFKLKKIIRTKKSLYDCALIINPAFIKYKRQWFNPYPTIEEVKSMLINKDMIFLSACGGDYIYNSYLPSREKKNESIVNERLKYVDKDRKYFLNILDSIRGVIPVMVDYADAYRKFQSVYKYNIFNTIPLPYDFKYDVNKIKSHNVIKIFHGISRSQVKGSDYIIKALSKISEQFQDKVTINIVSRLPLNEYILLMEDSDIILDQCYVDSYGLNAIEALSMGKIVLSGNEPNNAKEFGIDYCPVINIKPSVEYIVNEITKLVEDPEKIKDLAHKSMLYAYQIHDCEKIAHKYIDLFEEEIHKELTNRN